tara:strand:- start:253 stop:1365 length:1113 start_codon:yes stop_codon:yes gene_type:complete
MALNTVSSDRLSTNVKTSNLGTELKKKVGQNKNLIINGAMLVAQRGTTSTTSGYGSVDRFRVQHSGTDEAPTQAQVDVASGTTPYTSGFRKAFRITNGNQTSGAGATDSIHFEYYTEAQDIANSGWNYLSSSSFITLSFWIKSSVAQNFQGRVRTRQGTSYNYAFETGSLTADTWTKITKTIPGNSNLQFDNDTAKNFQIDIYAFYGTDFTSSAVSLNTWAAYASGTQVKDVTSTWYTTNDATLEITGVQLEVGSVATDFEHRSFAEELQLCKRYYYDLTSSNSGYTKLIIHQNGYFQLPLTQHPVEMRAAPTITFSSVARRPLNGGSDTSESISSTGSATTNWQAQLTNTSNTFHTMIFTLPIKFEAEL